MKILSHSIIPIMIIIVFWWIFERLDMTYTSNRAAVIFFIIIATIASYSLQDVYMNGEDLHIPVHVLRVIDGDTIEVIASGEQKKVRLEFIDAPEIKQSSGQASKSALKRMLRGRFCSIVYDRNTKSRHMDRDIARVFANGLDVQMLLLKEGMAFVDTKYDLPPKYIKAFAEAKSLGVGVHANNEEHPALYRQRKKEKQNKLKAA